MDMLLEAGRIVNTHGVRGEVKIQPWADSPEFLTDFETLYIDGAPRKVRAARVHKGNVLVLFEDARSIDDAIALKNKTVCIDRRDARLNDGEYFIADLVGLRAVDDETGAELGTLIEVMPLPAGNVYVIRGEREILVPAVPEFIRDVSVGGGYIRLRLIEGM